ncbi:retinitis pigmentosa 9 protein isoform X2 [Mirounga angustirostris]|uniref:retinitis pigmentosa 9 protein isoform X3 n=1 Tax=Mirounga leonina TaxID=9715 RepID=UPI00156BF56C|nr:retinitis pigmentosa 9 protein isoform X3 [Mirounga leonina]
MKNLLLGLSRKMRLSQKTVYQMYQATNMPGNFWLTHQRKDSGCHWGKKSKLCSVSTGESQVTLLHTRWRCKRYGHRTGDKECPFFIKGNQKLEQFRVAHEDPMYDIIRENKRHEKDVRIQQLKQLLEDSTSDEDGSSSSSSECKEKHKKKKKKEKHKKRKKEKKKKKKRKHKSSKSNESSDSD